MQTAPSRNPSQEAYELLQAAIVDGKLQPNERPTIPVPAPLDSEVRLRVTRVTSFAATVDLVVCDPRCEGD
jgi:hypothetical protein